DQVKPGYYARFDDGHIETAAGPGKIFSNGQIVDISSATDAADAARMQRMADSLRTTIERAVLDSLVRQGRGPANAVLGAIELAQQVGARTKAFMSEGGPPPGPPLPPPSAGSEFSKEAFAKRATTMGPPRRIVIADPPVVNARRPEASAAAVAALDTLRRAFAQSKRYLVVRPELVRSALARTRTIDDLADEFQADLFVSLRGLPHASPDSTVWLIQVHDLGATSAFRTRVMSTTVALANPAAAWSAIVAMTKGAIEELDRAPRRTSERYR
ncbi:MAG: hypothetical protein K2X99_08260, partial [Gemmatimonadaceae bacterium]|nr:hypothetical protein [Gemmatimonadaceae bacterium]